MKQSGGDLKKHSSNRRGYTLVETTLAMAVAASLFMLTFGLSNMVSNNRFKDTLNSSYIFLRTQYSDVGSGIDSRTGTMTDNACGNGNIAGNNANCYAIGRRIYFYRDSNGFSHMASVDLVGTPRDSNRQWPASGDTGSQALGKLNLKAGSPEVANGSSNNLTMSQGDIIAIHRFNDSRFTRTMIPDRYGDVFEAQIDLMRDPKSAQTVYVSDHESAIDTSTVYAIIIKNSGAGNYQYGLVCIHGGNAGGLSYNTNIGSDEVSNPSTVKNLCNNWGSE